MNFGEGPSNFLAALQSTNIQIVLLTFSSFGLVVYALGRARRLRGEESSLAPSERPWNYRFGTTIQRLLIAFLIVFVIGMLGALKAGGSARDLLLTAIIIGVGLALIFLSAVALMAVVRLLTRRW